MVRKVLGIGVLCVVGLAVGIVVYANFFVDDENTVEYKMPEVAEAPYSISAGRNLLILTASYEQFGQVVGDRIYVCHGYWEMVGIEFKYRSHDIIVSEQTYGAITVKRR